MLAKRPFGCIYPCLALGSALLLGGCGVQTDLPVQPSALATGKILLRGGQQPIQNATIQLYAAGTVATASAATPLLTKTVRTAADGSFNITGLYTCPTPSTPVYLVGAGGNPGLAAGTNNSALVLMGAIGRCGSLASTTSLDINEVTTVAAVAGLWPYMASATQLGAAPGDTGITAAFTLAAQLANVANGATPGTNVPVNATVPTATIDTLADIVASCIDSKGGVAGDGSPCGTLFSLVQAPGYATATDTVAFLLHLAQMPALNTQALFNQLAPAAPFQPLLAYPPPNFAIGLSYSSSLSLSQSAIAFPSTYVGANSASQAIVVSNTGGSALTLSGISTIESSGGADYRELDNCPSLLPPFSNCTAWVSFSPAAAGKNTGYVVVNGPAGALYASLASTGAANPPTTFAPALNTPSVFMGASICQYWPLPYNDVGIAGQVSAQMLARFPTDVLGHGYSRVVILGGSNDIIDGYNIPATLIPNLQAMGTMAQNAGMQVVLSLLPPIDNGVTYPTPVSVVDPMIKQLAIQNGWLYVDFYTPMLGHPEYFIDGLHPNPAGYAVMEAALAATVTK